MKKTLFVIAGLMLLLFSCEERFTEEDAIKKQQEIDVIVSVVGGATKKEVTDESDKVQITKDGEFIKDRCGWYHNRLSRSCLKIEKKIGFSFL